MKKDPDKKDEPKEKKPRVKKVDYEGSRWSALGLFVFTILVGFFLYLSGGQQ